ncbi:hypothetical protein ALI22I_33875 [Saccharothrix sp. ALI-22-I]|uniref:hypothetical protein n=1 Tax=Saccharothrix sp. ALI-22-I TaxID=1933778 RepID=UPI00097BCC1A|nr:hypothetical protein [Saccharothrix sp. ALI-22-I]ONI83485.1 hypothetical protein ALI22I_33875 [Saccharothrix sp. ALI-22-I]
MSAEIRIYHAYSPDQYAQVVELWERLLSCHRVGLSEDRYGRGLDKIEPEWLYQLVMSDGAETYDYPAVTVTVAEYSDYNGDEYDAANVAVLEDQYGLNTRGGSHGWQAAWVQLGELPVITDDTIDVGIERLKTLVEVVEALTQGDVVCLDDDVLEDHRQAVIEDTWVNYYARELSSALEDLTDYNSDDLGFSDEEIKSLYFEFEGNDWEFQGATEITNNGHDEAVEHVIETIRDAWRAPYVDPDQFALPLAS